MATISNNYTGNGSTTNYSFTFEYLEQSEVKVTLDGANTTAFTFANATTLSFTTAPANGVDILIYRDTNVDVVKATFFPGSAIKAEDLNENFKQNNYAVQELVAKVWDTETETIHSNETWVSNDLQVSTTAAQDSRFPALVQTATPTGTNYATGKLWFQNDSDKTLSIWNGSAWLSVVSGGTFTNQPKVVYVDATAGDDNADGHRISTPNQTIKAANNLREIGVQIVIGPVFYKSLEYLDEVENMIFVSLTNKNVNLPKNIISAGVNATSQLNTIKKFIDMNGIKKTIFLTPELNYEVEIKKAIKDSKIKIFKHHLYDTEPTKLTAQIEKITNYKIRKQNLLDEIKRVENSELIDKEQQLEKLKKRYTIGNVNFDSVIISDFDESLKSVITSLLYTDVSPKSKLIITFNQWFDESLLKEKTIQPIYYPSINRTNLKNFEKIFFNEFKEYPNYLSLLSYDLVGLLYYLSLDNELKNIDKIFKKKNSFKGKIGIFNIKDNKINHKLNFYQVNNGKLIEIF
mgnify:CR=1 FL=1